MRFRWPATLHPRAVVPTRFQPCGHHRLYVLIACAFFFTLPLSVIAAFAQDSGNVAESPVAQPQPLTQFADEIRPLLMQYCGDCHAPDDDADPVRFLRAKTAEEISSYRSAWSSAAEQLHNRTMPPSDADQPSEEERLRLAAWIESHLDATACDGGQYAGRVLPRRLNRDQYTYAVEDLTGLDFDFVETFPADGGGGEGFDNNAETLFLPPLLMERYLEVAERVVDRMIVVEPIRRAWRSTNKQAFQTQITLPHQEQMGFLIHHDDQAVSQAWQLAINGKTVITSMNVKADGKGATSHQWASFTLPKGNHLIRFSIVPDEKPKKRTNNPKAGTLSARLLQLPRGRVQTGQDDESNRKKVSEAIRRFAVHALDLPANQYRPAYHKAFYEAGGSKLAERLTSTSRFLGLDETPGPDALSATSLKGVDTEEALTRFSRQAWRQPPTPEQIKRLRSLLEFGITRGQSRRHAIQLPLIAILTSPRFLFVTEGTPQRHASADSEFQPISDLELASRLSFFLWHSLPDAALLHDAERGQLSNASILREHVWRMLDDPKSKRFAKAFAGQWLGTAAVGNTVIPDTNFFRPAYNEDMVRSLRAQVTETMHHMLREDHPITDWIDCDYVVINPILAELYGMKKTAKSAGGKSKSKDRNTFFVVETDRDPNAPRRAGVLGMGAVHMLTSYSRRTSPVLRGAWVMESLLGARIPAPPPDVPNLPGGEKERKDLTVRERLEKHRENATCAACHDLIDPIGFALESFDVLGRFRTTEADGEQALDTTGQLPSGETFQGVAELRSTLMARRDDFAKHYVRRMLGFALARSLETADSCTIDGILQRLESNEFRTRELIMAIVESTPFRQRQIAAENSTAATASRSQDGTVVSNSQQPTVHP